MTIGEYLKRNDRETYSKLKKIGRSKHNKKNEIKLGDSIENLMKHDAFVRVRGALRQIKWE